MNRVEKSERMRRRIEMIGLGIERNLEGVEKKI